MLIIIDKRFKDDIANICAIGPIPTLRGITNLLQSHADGQHIVVASPEICRILEDSPRLSEEQRATAKKIRTRFSELAGLKNVLSIYAEISVAGHLPKKNKGIWTLPLDWVAMNKIDATNLICEDLYDCELIREAGVDYLYSNELHKLALALEYAPGGGGNTHRTFQYRAVQGQKVSLCVVDSDRTNPDPSAPYGPTANACTQVSGDGVYELLITEGRELENHIPLRLIDQIFTKKWHGATPSAASTTLEAQHAGISLYADLKAGVRKFDVDTMTGSAQVYWRTAMASLPHCTTQCCSSNCTTETSGACKQIIVEPLGRKLLKLAGAYLRSPGRAGTNRRQLQYLPSPNDDFWKTVGMTVAAYGICVKPSRGI